MIRVTVELVPFGTEPPVVIGQAIISNDIVECIRTDGKRGSYDFRFTGKKSWLRSGHISNFPRKSANVWQLIARCLEEADVK